MKHDHEAVLDAFRCAVGVELDATQGEVLAELRSMPAPVIVLAIECVLGLLADDPTETNES
jgi:hypothetical protein